MFSQINHTMKKIALFAALMLTLVACSKQHDALLPVQKTQKMFSRVKFYNDGRKPATDTVMTIQLATEQMEQAFSKECGLLFTETSYYREVGVCWSR